MRFLDQSVPAIAWQVAIAALMVGSVVRHHRKRRHVRDWWVAQITDRLNRVAGSGGVDSIEFVYHAPWDVEPSEVNVIWDSSKPLPSLDK